MDTNPSYIKPTEAKKTLLNVLGVVYAHTKSTDGGDLYFTRFAERYERHLAIDNWYEEQWFNAHKLKLLGTSSVFKVPTKPVEGRSVDLVVKNCRVGEEVPLNTHTLQEFCDAEFNSPWEEFMMVMEMREGRYGPSAMRMRTQRPLAIYIPPETMQLWQSGRSRSKINRIRARHPGIDLDILKQYKLVYEWIYGKNLIEIFEHIDIETPDMVEHLKDINRMVLGHMGRKGYLMADMKPEHVIIEELDAQRIERMGQEGGPDAAQAQVEELYRLLNSYTYSLIDYELLFRTPEHEDAVKSSRRHSYLDDQRNRFVPAEMPEHLTQMEILGVPYIFGHTESTGGRLWVVGKNARLFDFFLPERWRKTPSLTLSKNNDVYYTITKDNIHLVWKTSRVGELLSEHEDPAVLEKIRTYGINSPFEQFALALELNSLGIPTVYVRAIYMTGGEKVEPSADMRRYDSHSGILAQDGMPVLMENHNYITIRGYYNGSDEWVAEHEDTLYRPIDLVKAVKKGIMERHQSKTLRDALVERLDMAGFDGEALLENDILIALDPDSNPSIDIHGDPVLIICNLEVIWRKGEQ